MKPQETPRSDRLAGKVALITGAARGQGRAHAQRLASEGADIIAVDICAQLNVPIKGATEADLAETARVVEATGRNVHAERADVRDTDGLRSAVARGVERLGRLDVVVANAGIMGAGLLWELSDDEWQEMIDVNLTGVWKTLKVTVPILIEQGSGGSIVLVSSVAGLRGVPFCAHYVAAKHGVVGLCRALANEVGHHDIRVNSIHPAGVPTEMIAGQTRFSELIEEHQHTLAPIFMNALPYKSVDLDDVASLVAFLASDESRFITGAQLPIDLGTLTR